MSTFNRDSDRCDRCQQVFEEGSGISGYDNDGFRKDYDFSCATALNLEVNNNGDLVTQKEPKL